MKRRAAEEAQRARLEMEKKEVEREGEEAKLNSEGQQEGGVKDPIKEEPGTTEVVEQEKTDCATCKGNYFYLDVTIK